MVRRKRGAAVPSPERQYTKGGKARPMSTRWSEEERAALEEAARLASDQLQMTVTAAGIIRNASIRLAQHLKAGGSIKDPIK